jgi:hypothetical protein
MTTTSSASVPRLPAERAAKDGPHDIQKTAEAAHANLLDDFCSEICHFLSCAMIACLIDYPKAAS